MGKDKGSRNRPETVNEALFDETVRRAVLLERLKAGEVNRVVRFLDDKVLPDVLKRIEAALPRVLLRPSGRDLRLFALQKALKDIIINGLGQVRSSSREKIKEIGLDEATWTTSTIRRVFPFELELTAPAPKLVKAALSTKGPNGRPLGRSWNDWWGGLARQTHTKVMQQVRIGVSSGESIPNIVRRVRGTRANRYRDGVWQTTRRQAETVVRTAVAHVSSRARAEVAKANEDVIKGVRWVSTLDSRTSQICASLDGQVFKVGEGIRPPAHPQCRSIAVPITKSFRELGIDLDDPPPPTRAAKQYSSLKKAVSGEVPANVSFGKWLRRQPREIQNQVLGVGKARLFRSGRVPMDRFVDQRHRPLTLTQLRKLERKLQKQREAKNQKAS